MWFAYVDESGDSGTPAAAGGGGSRTYTLGCLLFEATRWPEVFDQFIAFRRWVREQYGLPMRAEIKANYLLHNRGPLRGKGLGEGARSRIYRGHMRLLPKLDLTAFAVVVRKDMLAARGWTGDFREHAWNTLLERLERFSTKNNSPLLLVHDHGEDLVVQKLARKARRHIMAPSRLGTAPIQLMARWLLDDPVPRDSAQSYFVQTADLLAYAAFRRVVPPGGNAPGRVCPASMWDEVGAARLWRVSMYSVGDPTGIKVRS